MTWWGWLLLLIPLVYAVVVAFINLSQEDGA